MEICDSNSNSNESTGNPSGSNKKHGRGDENSNKDSDSKRVVNSNKNHKKWQLKSRESFAEIFWKNRDRCPKINNKEPCVKLFVKGWCTSNCDCLHFLTSDQEKEFAKYCNICRSIAGHSKKD